VAFDGHIKVWAGGLSLANAFSHPQDKTLTSTCQSVSGLVGYTGGHVLGNFSVTKQRGEQGTGVSAKIKDLLQGMKDYAVVLESGGKLISGSHTAR
jgi:hypothetical protein